MKKYLMFLLLLLPLSLTSCGGDEKDEPNAPNNTDNSEIYNYTLSPSGYGGGRKFWMSLSTAGTANPSLAFAANYRSGDGCESCKINRIGVVSSLAAIKTIPSSNWQVVEHGYDMYGSRWLRLQDIKEKEGFVVEIVDSGISYYCKIWIKSFNKSADGSIISINIEQDGN